MLLLQGLRANHRAALLAERDLLPDPYRDGRGTDRAASRPPRPPGRRNDHHGSRPLGLPGRVLIGVLATPRGLPRSSGETRYLLLRHDRGGGGCRRAEEPGRGRAGRGPSGSGTSSSWTSSTRATTAHRRALRTSRAMSRRKLHWPAIRRSCGPDRHLTRSHLAPVRAPPWST